MSHPEKYKLNINKIALALGVVMVGVLGVSPSYARDNVFRPYLYNGTDSQLVPRVRAAAPLSDWASTPGDAVRLVKRFMDIGVIDHYAYHVFTKSPLLTVGPGFYRLSHADQHRVVELVDYVYKGTHKKPGTIFINDCDTDRLIGLYTRAGLRLE